MSLLTNVHRDDLNDGVSRNSHDVHTLSVFYVPGGGSVPLGRAEDVPGHVVGLGEDGRGRERVHDTVHCAAHWVERGL